MSNLAKFAYSTFVFAVGGALGVVMCIAGYLLWEFVKRLRAGKDGRDGQ